MDHAGEGLGGACGLLGWREPLRFSCCSVLAKAGSREITLALGEQRLTPCCLVHISKR